MKLLRHNSGLWIRPGRQSWQDAEVICEVMAHDCYRVRGMQVAPKTVLDVGAHIGCFAMMVHERFPAARIVCVEACPENLECLRANVGGFAMVIHAACTYEKNVVLLNSYKDDGTATGGSRVVTGDEAATFGHEYWRDERPLPVITLEWIMGNEGWERIDLLKLDCEGSEHSILSGTHSLDKIGAIVGEYHGAEPWRWLVAARFGGWRYEEYGQSGELGNFRLAK